MHDKPKIRLLVIEEDVDQTQHLRDLFDQSSRSNLTVDVSDTLVDSKTALKRGRYDLVLVGSLPDQDAIQIREALVRDGYLGPMVVMCDYTDQDLQREALNIGFSDMLIKGKFTVDTLERSVLGAAQKRGDADVVNSLKALITQVKLMEDRLEDIRSEIADYRKEDQGFHENASKLIHQLSESVESLCRKVDEESAKTLKELRTPPWRKALDLYQSNPTPFVVVLLVVLALLAGLGLPTLLGLEVVKGLFH